MATSIKRKIFVSVSFCEFSFSSQMFWKAYFSNWWIAPMRQHLLRQIEGFKPNYCHSNRMYSVRVQLLWLVEFTNQWDTFIRLFIINGYEELKGNWNQDEKVRKEFEMTNDKRPWFIISKAHNNWISILNGPLHSFHNKWKKQFNNKCSFVYHYQFRCVFFCFPFFCRIFSFLCFCFCLAHNRFIEWNLYRGKKNECIVKQ